MFQTGRIPLILIDIVCLGLVGLPFFILTPQHSPFKRGFFCSDDSIRYPVKEETISYQLLGGVMIPFIFIVLICGECLTVYVSRVKTQQGCSEGITYMSSIYRAIGSCIFGGLATMSLTDIAKNTIGRLRPHFLAACKPVEALVNCKAGEYVENFTCTGDQELADEARLSFYSGHSSFSMYCMLFLVLYIQVRLKYGWARLLRPTVQFFLLATAIYVGLSRVSDYMHHWSDVLIGFLQGAVVAILTVVCVSDNFRHPPSPEVIEEDDISQTSLQENPSNGNHYGSTE